MNQVNKKLLGRQLQDLSRTVWITLSLLSFFELKISISHFTILSRKSFSNMILYMIFYLGSEKKHMLFSDLSIIKYTVLYSEVSFG